MDKNFKQNVKGHAPASEGADDNGTAPPNQGGNSKSEREAGCCAPPCSPLLLSVKVYDTGLSEKELETVRSFIRLQHPEMDGPLLFPSKDSVPQDQKDSFEFCQAPNADEFREEHRQLYIRAKQYMGFLDNPTAANFESLSKEVQDLLRREGKIPSDSNFRANVQVDSAASPLDVPRLVRPFNGWVKLSSGQLIPVKDIEYIGALNNIEFQAPEHVKCYMTKNGRVYHLSDKEYAEICEMVEAANLG